mgnify:CR=1 FL=1
MKKLGLETCQKLRDEGKTYKEIADYFKVSKQAVFDLLDKTGSPRKTKYSKYYEEWEKLYQEGMSTNEIAKKYNCNQTTVYHYLSKKIVIDASKAAERIWKKRKQKPVKSE